MKLLMRFSAILMLLLAMASCGDDDDDNNDSSPDVTYEASLDGASEVPAVTTTATGTATLTFNTTTKIFSIVVTHSGVEATAGHIHKAAVGENGGVIFPFENASSPINFTSEALDATQEADLAAGLYYVNIHSADNPGGEIRGQLTLP